MSNYTLSNSAAVIDSAITRVASADTTPTANSESMVTSGGVKAALDLISTGSTLTVDSFAATSVETSTDTITDTNTAIPTSAAVKDYVEGELFSASPGHSRLTIAGNINSGAFSRSSSGYIPFQNYSFSIGQIVTLSGTSTFQFPAGTYMVTTAIGRNSNSHGSWRIQLRHNGSVKMQSATNKGLACTIFVSSNSVQNVQIYASELGSGVLEASSNSYLTVTRLYG